MSSANTLPAAATDATKTRGKRLRSNTPRTSLSTSSSSSLSSPEAKIARSSTSPGRHDIDPSNLEHSSNTSNSAHPGTRTILCTLPPTCNHHPTILPNSRELERHYATYHAHVCEQLGCACVFPDARLLELHQTECHDPLAVVRRERGEKIFACHLATCGRLFSAPKSRRLHMIEAHKYPKEFFFAVTNKGIGGLLKKWGEGASMIRKEWKPRDNDDEKTKGRRKNPAKKGNGKGAESRNEGDRNDAKMAVDEESDSDDEDNNKDEEDSSNEEEMDIEDIEKTPRPQTRTLHPASPPSSSTTTSPNAGRKPHANTSSNADSTLDSLTQGMSSLSLVPPSVRFGRGGRAVGLGHSVRGRGRGGRGGLVPPQAQAQHQRSASAGENAEQVEGTNNADRGGGGRGRGKRGHGRGGNYQPRGMTSVGSGMDMDTSSPSNGGDDRGSGGNAILVTPGPITGPIRGRGGRGRRGIRGKV